MTAAAGVNGESNDRSEQSSDRSELPPLVELHLHIEGTLEHELVFELAERNGVALPWSDAAELAAAYDFVDLQSFLDLYYANMAVLRTRADFAALTSAYLSRAHRAGVLHTELFFDPQVHLAAGLELADVVGGIHDALGAAQRDVGITSRLIACILRDRPPSEAVDLVQMLVSGDVAVDGIGLDSAEVGYPPELFAEAFAHARAAGLHVVAHAGEEGGPEYVRGALDALGAERIDHGIRSMEDAALVTRLASASIPLTVCPLSNVRLRTVDTLADHPLPRMLEAGLLVSINSDDPAYFGGYVDDNFRAVTAQFQLSVAEQALLARNAVNSAFVDADRRNQLLAAVAAWQN